MNKFDAVESWIANVQYSHSKSEYTGERYRRELKVFCDFIEKTPAEIIDEYKNSADREFKRQYALYLRAFIAKMTNQGYAPNTINSRVAVVKSFFKYNDLPLGHVPIGKLRIIFHNRDIDKEIINQILAISRPRDKACFCIIAQSGLRPDILTKLRYKHIQEEFEKKIIPMQIYIPSEIAKGQYGSFFTFVGEESVKYLKAYLTTRPQMKPDDYLFTSYEADKKLNAKSLSKIFNHTIRKLERKELIKVERKATQPTERKKIVKHVADVRLYNLRKFFRKEAGQAGIEYVNYWMGHKTNYKAPHIPSSDEHYFPKDDVEFHRKLYAEKAAPNLRLETPTPSETEQTIEELREQLKERNNIIQKQEERLHTLEEFMKDTLSKMSEYAAMARELKSLLPKDRRQEILKKLKAEEVK